MTSALTNIAITPAAVPSWFMCSNPRNYLLCWNNADQGEGFDVGALIQLMVSALTNGAPASSWYSYFGLGISLILPLSGVAYLLGQIYDAISNGVIDFRSIFSASLATGSGILYYQNIGDMILHTVGFLVAITNIGLAIYNAYNVMQLVVSDSQAYGLGQIPTGHGVFTMLMGMIVSASIYLTTTTLGENWANFSMIVGKRQGLSATLKQSPTLIAGYLTGTGAAFVWIDFIIRYVFTYMIIAAMQLIPFLTVTFAAYDTYNQNIWITKPDSPITDYLPYFFQDAERKLKIQKQLD